MKLPKKIKVGYLDYPLYITEDFNEDCGGLTSHFPPWIKIRPMPDQQFRMVLLHEVGHAIWSVWEMRNVKGQEAIVAAYTNGLSTVIRDNPWLRKML